MSFSCGIVGLPNVGKSTLFNALTKSEVPAENYPFCTIEPNKAVVTVPDTRVRSLNIMSQSEKTIYTTISFVDIAGLVKGASKGEGLGNKFISHIKGVDAIAHVVRLFENENVLKDTPIDPIADLQTIHQELILYDLEQCDKHIKNLEKSVKRTRDKTEETALALLRKAFSLLEEETLLSRASEAFTDDEKKILRVYQLVTLKPLFIIGNLNEKEVSDPAKLNPHYTKFAKHVEENGFTLIELSAELERELIDVGESLLEETISPYLSAVGLTRSGSYRLIRTSYDILSLITFFTTGEQETRAWTIPIGTLAPQAAGVIHTDFEKGFIKADIIQTEELLKLGSYKKARELGKIRLEGKNYVMQDGDVCHFKFNL